MNCHRRLAPLALLLLGALMIAPPALAHPLGNFTINHYAGLHVTSQAVKVDYVLDMAEIPAFEEIAGLDTDRDGQPASPEAAAYHPAKCLALASDLSLTVDWQPLLLPLQSSSIEFPAGAGGLLTLRLNCVFQAELSGWDENAHIEFQDNSYSDRLGWREIVVTSDGLSLEGRFSADSISGRLTAYPNDLLNRPPDWRRVEFSLLTGPSGLPAAQAEGTGQASTCQGPACVASSSQDLGWSRRSDAVSSRRGRRSQREPTVRAA